MSFRLGESQDWVGWFTLRYTSTLFFPLGSHARGLLSTAEEFFLNKKLGVKKLRVENNEERTKPEEETPRALKFFIRFFSSRLPPATMQPFGQRVFERRDLGVRFLDRVYPPLEGSE